MVIAGSQPRSSIPRAWGRLHFLALADCHSGRGSQTSDSLRPIWIHVVGGKSIAGVCGVAIALPARILFTLSMSAYPLLPGISQGVSSS